MRLTNKMLVIDWHNYKADDGYDGYARVYYHLPEGGMLDEIKDAAANPTSLRNECTSNDSWLRNLASNSLKIWKIER